MTETAITTDESLLKLRQALRLYFEFQQSMLNIALYVKNRLSFQESMQSYPKYSVPVKEARKLPPGTWAWDFLPGYCFEYYMGERTFSAHPYKAWFSLIQLLDDGSYTEDFYGRPGAVDLYDCPQPAAFDPVSESGSWLAFYMDICRQDRDCALWMTLPGNAETDFLDEMFTRDRSADQKVRTFGSFAEGEIAVFQKFRLEHFANKASADAVIETFCRTVYDLTQLELIRGLSTGKP